MRLAVACALMLGAAAIQATPALAGRASTTSIEVVFEGFAGETNDVTITKPNGLYFQIVDPGVPMVAGSGCHHPTIAPDLVLCETNFGMRDRLRFDLGDENDKATFSAFNGFDATGGPGDDVLTVGASVCFGQLKGGPGNDTLNAGSTGQCGPVDELYGEDGNDVLNGSARKDKLWGGPGDDILNAFDGLEDELDGGLGADVLNGGAGDGDILRYTDRSTGVTVDLDGSAGDDGEPGEGDTVGADVEDVEGGSGNDTLNGNASPNSLRGWGGNDTLVGGDASDSLFGDAGNDVELGGPGIEVFEGVYDGGDNTWNGGEGDDVFGADNAGADTVIGGPGMDRVSYQSSVARSVTLDGLPNDGAAGENDNVGDDVEHVQTGGGHDVLVGSDGDNYLDGGNGNDTISGAGGNDTLNPGGSGFEANVLNGGPGTDTADYSRAYQVTVSLDGVANDGQSGSSDNVGTDVEGIIGGNSNDVLRGNDGANVLKGGEGSDRLEGGNGADTLYGGWAVDTLEGGDGDDALAGGLDGDAVRGQAGTDVADYSEFTWTVVVDLTAGTADEGFGPDDALTGVEAAVGGAGDDALYGDVNPNRLEGGPGDDVLDGHQAADLLVGGPGADIVDYRARSSPVGVDLEDEGDDGEAGENDTLRELEGIWGGAGNDSLAGSGGDDAFDGGPGADVMNGGPGFDFVDYSDRVGDVFADLDSQAGDDGEQLEGDSLGADLEAIAGGDGDDKLAGNERANDLDGGPGDDVLDGGLGPDELIGGAGFDVADYSGHSVGVLLDFDSETGDDGAAGEGDTIGTTFEALVGGSGGDVLNGNDGANDLYGGPGVDQLEGRGGDDLLNGGTGADSLSGGAGFDLSDYSERSGGVSVDLDGSAGDDGEPGESDTTWSDVEDVAGGAGNDSLVGNGAENFLFGHGGNDSLDGVGASDSLFGGTGDDHLASRDGFIDDNDCGAGGGDRATMDWFDAAIDCEQALGPAPDAATGGATEITQTAARLSGAVNPLGNATAVYWELGPTSAYGTRTANVNLGANAGSSIVSAAVAGLAPGTTYHYRVVATNGGGTSYGIDRTFSTAAAPPPPRPPPAAPPRRCVVARVVGKPLRVARRLITKRRCRVGKITRRPSRVVRKGIVLAQRPRAGRRLPRGSKVSLVVSSGKPRKRAGRR
jgi:Ca2+-binding RTX toxin-like protein